MGGQSLFPRVHRFFVSPSVDRGTPGRFTLSESDSHHAARVLRLAPGDPVELLDGAGRVYAGRLATVEKRAATVTVVANRSVPAPPAVVLAPALLKGKAMDWLVQKATELGAAALHPLSLARCVAQVSADEAAGKVEDWAATAREACKQCGNPWLPRIHAPQSLAQFLAVRPAGLLIVASLGPGVRSPRALVAAARAAAGPARAPLPAATLVLGPEGDFTADEEASLREAGALPMTLGPLVLRAETAALAGLAVLQQELSGAAV